MDQTEYEGQQGENDSPRAPRAPPRSMRSDNWRVKTPASESNSENEANRQRKWNDRDNRDNGGQPQRGNDSRGNYRPRNDWRPSSTRNEPHDSSRDRRGFRSGGPSSGSAEQSSALAEGRRIYIGNMLYHIRPEQLKDAFITNGFGGIEDIHISIDPVTGRNPGYCFVEFETKEGADAALEGMAGVQIEGRALKTGPCNPRDRAAPRNSRWGDSQKPTFERWGNWNGEGGIQTDGQGPTGAEEHLIDIVKKNQQSRVYVGGLGKMINQYENDQELQTLFEGFDVVAVSKRITPHESTRARPGNHHYAFVDLSSAQEAKAAVEALNGKDWQGSPLRVSIAQKLPSKIAQRGARWDEAGRATEATETES